jgi:hypothetical protein
MAPPETRVTRPVDRKRKYNKPNVEEPAAAAGNERAQVTTPSAKKKKTGITELPGPVRVSSRSGFA